MSVWHRLTCWVLLTILLAGLAAGFRFSSAYAQAGDEPMLHFAHLTSADGLSHNNITAIIQDRQGFIWIGTQDGLNRFDGYQFITYRYNPDDPNSLSHNHVRDILEDESGALWIATQGGGLDRFDPLTETFTRYLTSESGNILFTAFLDRVGALWIGGPPPGELAGLDASQVAALAAGIPVTQVKAIQPAFRHYELDAAVPPAAAGGAVLDNFRGGVQAIVEDAEGRLWLAADLALVRFDPNTDEMRAFIPHPDERLLNTIVLDTAGRLWVGGNTGLYEFDPATEQFTKYDLGFDIEALYLDGDTLWVGGLGLYAFDLRTERVVQRAVHREHFPDGLSDGVVTAIYKDAGGVLWIGTSEGLNLFDPRQSQFSHYRHDPDDPASLFDDQIQAIAGDAAGQIWLATPLVLDRFDPATGEATHYFPKPDRVPFPGLGLSALCSDREGDVWVGVGDRVYRLDVETGAFELYDTLRTRVQPGPPPTISAIVEDRQGQVWIGMALVGLHRFDRQTGEFHTYLADGVNGAAISPALISDRISALYVGHADDLWIGYRDGFLSRFDPAAGLFTHYTLDTLDNRANWGWIEAIYEDEAAVASEAGTFWLATRSGLVRLTLEQDGGVGAARRYTEKDGLPATYVQSILAEQDGGYLWLGTTKGLSRFDPRTETFDTFDAADGLGGNVFNGGAAWQAPHSGRMYFGGAHGLTAFYPDRIELSDYQPPVLLTEFRLANEPVTLGANGLLQRPIWDTERLTLHHDDDLVSFEFAALSYAAPHKLRYRYRLEGLESDWVEVDSRHRFATYTHLPAGDYVFRVQATNASGLWSAHEATLSLTVLPPWWETWWFRGGILLLITAVVGGVVHWRINDIRRRNIELQAQVAARTSELVDEKAHVETAHAVLRTVLDNLDAVIYVSDMTSYEILFANAQVRETFGHVEGDICWQVLQKGQQGPCAFCTNAHLLNADGEPTGIYRWQFQNTYNGRWYTVADSAVEWIDGRLVRLSMAADITEYREAERRLLAQQRLLAALDERERIGRELHDDLGQVMGYVNVQAQTVRDLLIQEQEAQAKAALHQLIQVAQEAHDDVRKYILGIRTAVEPRPLDFLTALEHYLEELEQRYGLTVRVNWPEDQRESPLAPAIETQLLRIIQEALVNVCKHAEVDVARLMFTLHPDTVEVLIIDEGRGFDVTHPNPQDLTPDQHFGLTIMRERAEGVGGSLDVRSQPGSGTQVVVRLPRRLAASADAAMRGLRVLLADDHDLYVQGLRNLLTARGVRVVGVAHDGLEALALARELLPDLILLDVHMPHCDGLEATRQIKAALPEVKIVMLTVAADDATLFEALKSGASGYLLKNLESRHFFELLSKIMRGEDVVTPTVAARALAEMAQGESDVAPLASKESPSTALTPRQREVLALLADGLTYLEIAQQLHISHNTVKYHVTRMLERLELENRYELAHYAREHDIITG